MPTLRQLEVFVSAATLGSLRRAAEFLGVSQPSVSKQMKALERAVGGALFERRRGASARLSSLGQSLLEDASRTLRFQKHLVRNRQSALDRASATVFIRHFMLENLKPKLAALYACGLPETTDFVLVDDSEDLVSRVADQKGALGLLRNGNLIARPGVSSLVLREEFCSLYAAPQLLEALERKALQPQELPILLVSRRRSTISRWVRSCLEAAGFGQANYIYGSQFIDRLLQDVLEGKGAAVFLDWHVRDLLEEGRLVRIASLPAPLHLFLVAHHTVEPARFEHFAKLFRADGATLKV